MSLILTTPPSIEPISLAEAKSHLRISHTDDDTYVMRIIAAARRQIEARLDVGLIQQSWSYFINRWPECRAIALPLSPVIAVTDVMTYSDEDVGATLDPAHYYVDRRAKPPVLALRNDRSVPVAGRRYAGIEVKMTVGYGTSAASVPEDIRQALLLSISAWYADRGENQSGFLPLMARELIAPYRHVRLA
jgi:uncharacterized phiE125 gp8 family phage protein